MTNAGVPPTEGLEITVQHCDEGSVVHLRGRLNIESSPAFRDQLLAMLRARSPEVVTIDLANVTYIDGSGMATLIEALKIARQRHSTLCLQGVQGRLLHLFEVSSLSTLFEQNGCRIIPTGPQVS